MRANMEYAALVLDPTTFLVFMDLERDQPKRQFAIDTAVKYIADTGYTKKLQTAGVVVSTMSASMGDSAEDEAWEALEADIMGGIAADDGAAAAAPAPGSRAASARRAKEANEHAKAIQLQRRSDVASEMASLRREYIEIAKAKLPGSVPPTTQSLRALAEVMDSPDTPSPIPRLERFWTEARRQRFPTIAFVLKEICALPASSVACESSFSHASLVMDSRRHRLLDATFESLTILHFDKWSIVRGVQRHNDELQAIERQRAAAHVLATAASAKKRKHEDRDATDGDSDD